jgi:hypothetical protein
MLRGRSLVLSFLAVTFLTCLQSAQNQTPSQSPTTQATTTQKTVAKNAPPNCSNNGTYVNSRGQTVRRPENCSAAPSGATAQCQDGSYSFSRSKLGTCSHHGGVAKRF